VEEAITKSLIGMVARGARAVKIDAREVIGKTINNKMSRTLLNILRSLSIPMLSKDLALPILGR
jgi:hypothetical protein